MHIINNQYISYYFYNNHVITGNFHGFSTKYLDIYKFYRSILSLDKYNIWSNMFLLYFWLFSVLEKCKT